MHRLPALVLAALWVLPTVSAQETTMPMQACGVVPKEFRNLGPAHMTEIDSETWIVYEDRVSRQPLRHSQRVLEQSRGWLEACGIAGIAPHRFGIAIPSLAVDRSSISRSNVDSIKAPAIGLYVDMELELLYNFAVGYQGDWIRDRIALGPKLKLWWSSGVMVSTQVAIPIRNQLPERNAEYWSKPYLNVLMAGIRRQLAPNWIGAVSAGFYERNRYGGDFQLYWISEGWPIVLGGRVSASGYWSFSDGELERGPVNFWTGYLDGTVYLPWYNIRLRGRTGQFIREISQFRRPGEDVKLNPGSSGEITRMFGETEIGLHAFYDGFNIYPGFRFAVPLSPPRGLKRGRVAVYPTRQQYVPHDLGRVVRGELTGFVRPNRGELHRTDLDIWSDLRILAPAMRKLFTEDERRYE